MDEGKRRADRREVDEGKRRTDRRAVDEGKRRRIEGKWMRGKGGG
jgi:hypothetical protein